MFEVHIAIATNDDGKVFVIEASGGTRFGMPAQTDEEEKVLHQISDALAPILLAIHPKARMVAHKGSWRQQHEQSPNE